MNKISKIVSIIVLTLLLVSVGSFAAVLGQPPIETRAIRIVEVAQTASEKVGDFIVLINTNDTVQTMIDEADLTEAFEDNITLYLESVEKVDAATECLDIDDYEGAITNATEALSIFREVYRSINIILFDSGVKLGRFVDVEELEEVIKRSQERVDVLKGLISEDAPIYVKLIDAEDNLTQALEFLPDNIDEAKASLREASILISEVCRYLKEIAQELNPQRIRDYCESAYQYRERFRERFGQAGSEGFDVNGFLQSYGYENEDDYMARFQEMIQNAEKTGNVEDSIENLEEIGRLIREMDQNLTQEMGHHRAQHGQTETGSGFGSEANNGGFGQEGTGGGYGQAGSGSGYGQYGGGYGESNGSGQMGFGSGH